MKFLILAAVSLSFLAQSNAQRRPGGGGGGQRPPPAQADNKCSFEAEEVTLAGSGETADSMAACAKLAFEAADSYCNAARAGNAGKNPYNPINTSWTWNGQKDTHPSFSCENVAINPKSGSGGGQNGGGGRPGQGGGRPGNGNGPGGGGGGGGGGNTEPTVVETYELTEANVREWLPRDVCLVDHPRWGRDFRRNRDRFTIDRDDAFCDYDEKWLRFERCNPSPQPVSSILPGTESWAGTQQSVSLGNQGQAVTVNLTSTEYVTEQYFTDTAREYNCSERDDFYRVQYVTYRVTRWSNGRRDRNEIRRDRDMVQGIRLKRDPIWTASRRNIPTGETSTATFTLEPQPFETQLNYTFGATVAHNKNSEPTFSFSDEFFSHNASFGNVSNGGTVSIQSNVRPISPPSISASLAETDKKNPRVNPILVNDPRISQLLSMSPQMETTYTVYGILMHRKLRDKEMGRFTVVVPNTTGNPNFAIDTETLLATAAQQTGNKDLLLDRRGKSYDLKFTISATRRNSKFVNEGEGSRTQEIKSEIEKF